MAEKTPIPGDLGARGPVGGDRGLGGPIRPEASSGNENIRRRQEATIDRLPVGGERVINLLLSAEVREGGDVTDIKKAIDQALSYREGLTFGVSGAAYEFRPESQSDRFKIANLQRMFTTVEGAINRSDSANTYINAAIESALDARIQRAQEYTDDPVGWQTTERKRLEEQNEVYSKGGERLQHLVLTTEQIASVIGEEVAKLENEHEAIPKLVELRSFVDSRSIFDRAFIIRMRTCEDPGLASKVGSSDIYCPTPDSPHWASLFNGEVTSDYGKGVAAVFEELVKMSLPVAVVTRLGMEPIPVSVRNQVKADIYAQGFDSAIGFGTWLNRLLEKANGRMDVVWGAWKLALTLEVADTLGETIDKNGGKFILASPPLGSALMAYLNHLREKRMLEFGLKADGSRASVEKFAGHSGLPMSIDHIPDLCSDYLHESKIKFDTRGMNGMGVGPTLLRNLPRKGEIDYDEKYDKLRVDLAKVLDSRGSDTVEISLWDLWLYGRISFADPKFPWYQTDQPDADATSGELPLGSFGLWLLTRSRSASVLEDIKSQPALRDLGSPDFFIKSLRNWTKVLGPVKGDSKPEDSPRMWWVMGIVAYHLGGTTDYGQLRRYSQQDFRDLSLSEELKRNKRGTLTGQKATTVGDVVGRAVECGFLRKIDEEYIYKYLNYYPTD